MSTIQKTTTDYVQSFANSYEPAEEENYTSVYSTMDILLLVHESNGRQDLDAQDAERSLKELGYKQLVNSSGMFWMVKARA
jgi:hypothetical protein